MQVYERYGKELCIVVTNLNMMNAEYFHPKTTPEVPVRQAVRMSMAIPGKPLKLLGDAIDNAEICATKRRWWTSRGLGTVNCVSKNKTNN